jgi:hypothetical protein
MIGRTRILAVLIAAGLAAASAPRAAAQVIGIRPHLRWQTLRTEHFVFHFPAEMRPWVVTVAARMEPVRDAVRALVGYAPPKRVTVVVEDPYNVSNGSAWPFLDAPAIYLWPTPPDPTSQIGNSRDWGEILAVHEFAHVAHLTRPSRNRWQRLLWSILPANLSPIARRSPRWVYEGYATYVEGKLTGSGRPHSAVRAALLRQWALEGQLPTYGQLDATEGYRTGSFAYLVGSAYLEWLVDRAGDSSLVHLWRRMTARRDRGFVDAFTGVYGDSPAALYGRFTAELTAKAVRLEEELGADSTGRGEVVQRFAWSTGDPALSKDGTLLAVPLRSRTEPGRIVVWKTAQEPDSAAVRKARAALLRRDPEDVPAVRPYPPARKAIATLRAVGGRSHDAPRFFADGKRLLVTRFEPTGDGPLRPDLFIWNHETGRLRRVTHGAAVRSGDPSPDGTSAVGVRCLNGICDLVSVDIRTGRVSVLAAGSPARSYHRPRYSPDGRSIAFGVQEGGVWRVAVADAAGGAVRVVGPADSVNRHSAAFLPDGRSLVLVSERGGIPNLETLAPESGETRALTRVTGAAYAPEPSLTDRTVYFLSEHSRGLDVRQIGLDAASADGALAVSPALAPAAPIPIAQADTFPARPLAPAEAYRLGPREHRVLVGGGVATEGSFATLLLGGSDPVGRLGWTAQGAYGGRSTWRGGALAGEWRRHRPVFQGELFYVTHTPSRQDAGTFAPRALDSRYGGATLGAELVRDFASHRHRYRVGASLGALRVDTASSVPRRLAFAEYGTAYLFRRGRNAATAALDLHGAAGSTDGERWQRGVARLQLGVDVLGQELTGTIEYGAVNRAAAAFEQFLVGGVASPLVDDAVLSQRVPAEALPVGVRAGGELYAYGVRADLGVLPVPYFSAVATRGGFEDAFRTVGAERALAVGAIPFVRLPSVRALVGVGYTLDEPFKYKTRGYLTLTYRP